LFAKLIVHAWWNLGHSTKMLILSILSLIFQDLVSLLDFEVQHSVFNVLALWVARLLSICWQPIACVFQELILHRLISELVKQKMSVTQVWQKTVFLPVFWSLSEVQFLLKKYKIWCNNYIFVKSNNVNSCCIGLDTGISKCKQLYF
jgi:hypothetical protein